MFKGLQLGGSFILNIFVWILKCIVVRDNMEYKIKLDRVQTVFHLLDFDAVTWSSKACLGKELWNIHT